MLCQDKDTYRSVGMLSASVGNRLFRDKNRVLQNPSGLNALYCTIDKDQKYFGLVFKPSGAGIIDKGMKH